MKKDNLTPEEKKLFESLKQEAEPPKLLEKNIISQLETKGLIKSRTSFKIVPLLQWAATIALAIACFFGGKYYQQQNTKVMTSIEPAKGYILLLHEDNRFQPGEPLAMFQEYGQWLQNTAQKGVKITGQELKVESVLVSNEGVQDQNTERRTTGYFLIEAPNLAEALKVAETNPHVKYGGIVELKPFMVR